MSEYIKFAKTTSGVFVDSVFINNLMPAANGDFVKVYLFALLKAEHGEVCTSADIADCLGLLESDVARALSYWAQAGVLTAADNQITFGTSPAKVTPVPSAQTVQTADIQAASQRPDIGTAADALASNKKLADMCMMAQEILGKTLTSQDTSTLYWFYDSLSLEPAAILILLEYCASKDKRSMNYIEKVAMAWSENGVKTMEQAESYLKKESEKGGYLNTIRKVMGINDRNFSHAEQDYLYKWRDEFNMGADMVALAYEYCIIQTSKLSFPYMDRILLRWNESGIHTVAQAEADNEAFIRQRNQTKPGTFKAPGELRSETDHEELERMAWESIKQQQKGDFFDR